MGSCRGNSKGGSPKRGVASRRLLVDEPGGEVELVALTGPKLADTLTGELLDNLHGLVPAAAPPSSLALAALKVRKASCSIFLSPWKASGAVQRLP